MLKNNLLSVKNKSVLKMTIEELRDEVLRLRKSVSQHRTNMNNPKVSAIDRTGREYNREELLEVFERVYPENPKALLLMFPSMNADGLKYRAKKFGLVNKTDNDLWPKQEDEIIKKHFPDYIKIHSLLKHRTIGAIKARCKRTGIKVHHDHRRWTVEEDDLLRQAKKVPNRSQGSCLKRRKALKINGVLLRQALSLSPNELSERINSLISRGYPDQIRFDAIQTVIEWCLAGQCGVKLDQLRDAAKRAVTATYKLHPDKGAPVSMDAKLFDDGDATVGDRISSDAFHF